MLSVGSLCTGYGGLEMGLQAVYGDIDIRFVSDIDNDANTLLAHHHPNVPNLGDLTIVDWADIEPVDVLCAGYPCQPFSTAGQRKGLDDERAIFEYIADAISFLRPRNVLLENVAGHLTLGGTAVIATLTRLRYNAKWGIVRASDAGAPHQRKRIFIWADNGNAKKRYAGNTKQQPMGKTTRQTAEFRKPTSEITTDSDSTRLQRLRGECELAENSGQKRLHGS
jgi:DNA (cytosine-5)-methyltransferase 1